MAKVEIRGCLETILFGHLSVADPPKSPLKRGTLNPVPPFLRGARGDLNGCGNDSRSFQIFSKLKNLWKPILVIF
jgi:hypothetical protein